MRIEQKNKSAQRLKNNAPEGDVLQRYLDIASTAPTEHLSDVASWHAHMPFARALVALLKPNLIVELGVHKGDSLLTMVDALEHFNVKGRAIGVDTWQGDEHAGVYEGDIILSELTEKSIRFGDRISLHRSTFEDALSTIEDGSVDLLHIDGLHTYDAVKNDFETWQPKLSTRGVVMLHDTSVSDRGFGVYKLWNEIAALGPSYNFSFGNGLGVICIGPDVPANVKTLIRCLNGKEKDKSLNAAALAAAIGEAYEGRSTRHIWASRLDAKHAELEELRTESVQEINRLNDEIVNLHRGYQSVYDKHTAVKDAQINTLNENFSKVNLALTKIEKHPISALIWPKTKKFFARNSIKIANRTAVGTVRQVFRLLPIPKERKRPMRISLIRKINKRLSIVSDDPTNYIASTGVSLRIPHERYCTLARAATGKPGDLPVRSVSIIVPVYNNIDYTLRCIEAVKNNTREIEYELIVIDDGSTDTTSQEISQRTDIIYICNSKNLGFIGSCNAGLEFASKNYVCYLNNDTEVAPYWLSALVNTFELHRSVGLVGSQLIYPNGQLQEAGGLIWDDFSGWNWGRLQDPENPQYCYARQADYCSGASILAPRELLEKLGGFDPEFTPAYGEDSDLAFRMRALGLSVIYQPLSKVIHYEGITSGTNTDQGVKAYQKVNAKKLAKRWAPVLPHQGSSGVEPEKAADRGKIGRVLVVDQTTPTPDQDAGSITALELMRTLGDYGYKVTFIPCSNFTHIPDYTDLLDTLGIESVLYPWCKSVSDHLEHNGTNYDAVIFIRVNTAVAHMKSVLENAPQAKIIYHASDLHFLREERAQSIDNPDIAERQATPESTKLQELQMIGQSNLVIVHSHYEKELLSELAPETQVLVFPWIYEPRGSGQAFEQRSDLVFLGGYRHYPNVDAVKYYAEDIAPLVRNNLPSAVFRAFGSNPPPEFEGFANANIVIEGFVEDLDVPLSKARIMVAPLRYGAGLKGKIVSSMAHGLPVITTTIGAEGMSLSNGENVLIADTPQEFADAITTLYNDEDLWQKMSKASLEYVAQTTSRNAGYKIVGNILDTLDLPTLPRMEPVKQADYYMANIGTPVCLYDPTILLHAAVGNNDDETGVLVVPENLANTNVPGWKVARYDDKLPATKNIIALIDSLDDESVDKFVKNLNSSSSARQNLSIVFVPPRMSANTNGYAVKHAFNRSSVEKGDARQPVHERHAERLSDLAGDINWRADTTLTGFPGVMIADWTS